MTYGINFRSAVCLFVCLRNKAGLMNWVILAKGKKEITSSSFQDPSDPDVTSRHKAGEDHKGYVGNIVETVGENGDGFITSVGYDTHIDSTFGKEYLNSCQDNTEPKTVITDCTYSGAENHKLAASKNTELITTALSGKETNKILPILFLQKMADW